MLLSYSTRPPARAAGCVRCVRLMLMAEAGSVLSLPPPAPLLPLATAADATQAELSDAVAARVTIEPPRDRFSSATVITAVPSADARPSTPAVVLLIRFTPLNSAFEMIVEI